MVHENIMYYMYDINSIHTILEGALLPVFHIDRTERKKKKIMKKRGQLQPKETSHLNSMF